MEPSTHRPRALPLNMNKLGAQIQWGRIAPGTDNAFVRQSRALRALRLWSPLIQNTHWWDQFSGFFFCLFFPLTSGVCLFASLSTLRSKRESEGNRWTGSQTHRIGPKKFYKSFARRRRGKRRRRTSEFLSLLAINIFAKCCQMNLSSV